MEANLTLYILEVVVAFCVVVATKYLVPWFKSQAYYNDLVSIVTLAASYVRYAERFIQGEKQGDIRFEVATELLTMTSAKLSLGLDEAQIGAIIQNAYDEIIGGSDTE